VYIKNANISSIFSQSVTPPKQKLPVGKKWESGYIICYV